MKTIAEEMVDDLSKQVQQYRDVVVRQQSLLDHLFEELEAHKQVSTTRYCSNCERNRRYGNGSVWTTVAFIVGILVYILAKLI